MLDNIRDRCFLIGDNQQGGGNALSMSKPSIIVRRNAALGDVLSSTVVAARLKELGYEVEFQSHPSAHPILNRSPVVSRVTEPKGYCHVDLDGAYETNVNRRRLHFNDMWFERANQTLNPYGIALGKPFNARPRLFLGDTDRAIGLAKFTDYPKPWVFICPSSQFYRVRSIPDHIWQATAKQIKGTVFWIGLSTCPNGIIDLQVRNISTLLTWLSCADLLLSVDTGPLHFAAALGVPVIAISQSSDPELHLCDQVDFDVIKPLGNLDCLNCQQNICPKDSYMPPCQNIDPGQLAGAVNARFDTAGVSAVIPIFQPSVEMLNRCLSAVLPQVQEVVITKENGGIVPTGTITDPKIRHVTHRLNGIGFGRNVNFGVRHSTHQLILILNDDVYLDAGSVGRLLEVMRPKVGIVGHLTRYPDGTIYHAGKPRAPGGAIGFPHIDHRAYIPTIKNPCEMENTNGASILVRRKAFYDIGGFDERFMFYAEDDDIAMRMRLHGWQVWYTPHATGIHDEHAETRKRSDMMQIMAESNALFGRLWAPYFWHNKNNQGLGNFDYLTK